MTTKPLDYNKTETPNDYRCKDCGAHGVRLYREYQTMLDRQTLRCTACALVDQNQAQPDQASAHSIGWLVAAVPTEENDTFWGYTSVPTPGVEWWNRLPVTAVAA